MASALEGPFLDSHYEPNPRFGSVLTHLLTQSQVKSYSPGEHEGSAQRKPQGPARWGRVVGVHAAPPEALWAARDELTCAGAELLAAFLSELRVLASLLKAIGWCPGRTRSRRKGC